MIVLALDTTGPHCAAAVARGDAVLAHASERIGRGHAERLAPMVIDTLREAGVEAGEVGRLAVCTGPGSFTGLRVALSYAKGFALPRRLPVVGVDALEIEAERLRRGGDALAVTFRDVRRGEVFAAQYSHGGPLEPPRAMTLEAAQALADDVQAGLFEADEADMPTLARMAAALDPAAYPAVPLYARAPDAKLPGGVSL